MVCDYGDGVCVCGESSGVMCECVRAAQGQEDMNEGKGEVKFVGVVKGMGERTGEGEGKVWERKCRGHGMRPRSRTEREKEGESKGEDMGRGRGQRHGTGKQGEDMGMEQNRTENRKRACA